MTERLLLLLSWAACVAQAKPGVPSLDQAMFQGGAVLQRDVEVAVWGTVEGAGPVTVYVDGVFVAHATVDASGNWTATLPPHSTAFNSTLMASGSLGNSTAQVSFGDVILCSGQSNMGMPVLAKGFQADNGTAEVAASGRYTGGIWLWRRDRSGTAPTWVPASPTSLGKWGFSAVCWYTGRHYFDALGGTVPVGLIQASVGGSPIEYWISPKSIAKCEEDKPVCDTRWNDSAFWDMLIVPLQPYTLGAIVWDQGERDLQCNHVAAYPCLLRELARSWRAAFRSPGAALVAVQLPCYFSPHNPGNPGIPGFATQAEGLFAMRLAQEEGTQSVEDSAVVATYDLSCSQEAWGKACPFGSVHNPHKQDVGPRVAAQLLRLMQRKDRLVAEGPRAQEAHTMPVDGDASAYTVSVRFAGGTSPFALRPTRNCTDCCGPSTAGDFDASHDGVSWALGSAVQLQGGDTVQFTVRLPSAPKHVRYTAGLNYTQCALYNKESFPALPFQMELQGAGDVDIISI